jgi:hypothetical protein
MAPFRKCVLCFGRDQMLLETRRMLLEQAGYTVLSTSIEIEVESALVNGDICLLVLCHSLLGADQEKICRFHRNMHSSAPILSLDVGKREPPENCGELFRADDGPAAFLALVRKLTTSLAVLNLEVAVAKSKTQALAPLGFAR